MESQLAIIPHVTGIGDLKLRGGALLINPARIRVLRQAPPVSNPWPGISEIFYPPAIFQRM